MPKIVKRKKEANEKNPMLGTIAKISIKIRSEWLFIGLIIVAYTFFYFVVRDRVLFTPDFISSDSFHINVSFKFELWRSLRLGILPFWTDKLAGGFPLIAESQIGAFFLPNLILLPLFSSFIPAYSFLFVFHLALLTIAMYFLLKKLNTPSLLALLLSVTFTWCGAISFRWVHFNLIQVFSISPIVFWGYFKWKESKSPYYSIFISFLVSQMIFAGHVQTCFIVLLGLTLMHIFISYPIKWTESIEYICIILLGFILAAPQVLPTLLLTIYSSRGFANTYEYATYLLFNMRDIVGFITPQILGTPQNGTYNILANSNRVYWENTPYLGELFSGLFIVSIILSFTNRINQNIKKNVSFLLLFLTFLILAFGGDSPLYFLFSVFPFNMFRAPSKYLLMGVFFIILYVSFLFKKIFYIRKAFYILICAILTANSILLIRTALNYHVFIDSRTITSSLKNKISLKSQTSFFTYGGNDVWNAYFMKHGWADKDDIKMYLFLASTLLPNSNLVTEQASFDIYTGGLRVRRSDYIRTLVTNSLSAINESQSSSKTISALTNILELYNIGTIISFKPLQLPGYPSIKTVVNGDQKFTIYQNNKHSFPLFYVPQTINPIRYFEEFKNEVESARISESNSFAENIKDKKIQSNTNADVRVVNNGELYLKSFIRVNTEKFIVVKKTWYPEWRLTIDGKDATIYKTNLIHMGFYIPNGEHTIEFRYVPISFYVGCISAFFGLIVFCYIQIRRLKRL